MIKVLGIGNALVDILIKIDSDALLDDLKLPKGSMQLVDLNRSNEVLKACVRFHTEMAAGGSAANTIHGMASLGIGTGYIGAIGRDEYGSYFESELKRKGIQPILLRTPLETGRAVALVSQDTDRTFATYLGAASLLKACDITPDLFFGFSILHVEGYLVQDQDLLEHILKTASAGGVKISLDMASYNIVEQNRSFLEKMIKKYIHIIFANAEEAKALTGQSPGNALNTLADLCEIAVVKVGAEGSLVRSGERFFQIAPIRVTSVDTTGAGDQYAAGFLYGLSEGFSLDQCGLAGSIMAGKVIENIGARIPDNLLEDVRLALLSLR